MMLIFSVLLALLLEEEKLLKAMQTMSLSLNGFKYFVNFQQMRGRKRDDTIERERDGHTKTQDRTRDRGRYLALPLPAPRAIR